MRSLPLLFVLALASDPYRLVLKDGTVLALTAPPEEKKGRLVGTTVGASGTLVAIRPEEVDRELTDAANRAAPTALPGELVVPLKHPGGPPLGDRVKLQVSPEEARRKLEAAASAAKPTPEPTPDDVPERAEAGSTRPPGKAGKEAAKDGPKGDEHLDRLGRGESFWREKAGRLRQAVEAARSSRERAEAAVGHWEREAPSAGGAAMSTWGRELARLRDAADRARREEQIAQKRLEALSEEARKADAYPGWLR